MDTKKLAKIIKLIVEQELKRQLPKLVKEGIEKEIGQLNEVKVVKKRKKKSNIDESDTQLLTSMMESTEETVSEQTAPTKQFSKNPILNDILNNTKPFGTDVNESMDKTLSFGTSSAQSGIDGMRAEMQHKMGLNPVSNSPKSEGLGVKTGLPGLDRILNRDNSELVKQFKTRK